MKKSLEWKRVPFKALEPWNLNPKDIRTDDLKYLAKKMKQVGVFRNFVTWPPGDDFPQEDNGRYIVGGGNARWLVLKEIWKCPPDMQFMVTLNFPENEQERIELSLLDNLQSGIYIEQPLAELLYPYRNKIDLQMFHFPFTNPIDLKTIVDGYGPDGDQINFVDSSDRHTITIRCKDDNEFIEMREYLGIADSKRNSIDASILRDILIKANDPEGLDAHKNVESVIRYYLKFLPPLGSESILDIGSGITTPYRGVLSNRTSVYRSLDIRPSSRVDYQADIRSLPGFKDKGFEWGWCVELLEHFSEKDQRRAVDEMIRICENLVIAFPTPDHENFSDDPSHEKVKIDFTEKDLKDKFVIEDHSTKNGRAIFILKSRRKNVTKEKRDTATPPGSD